MKDELFLAWAAGFFDGEGCVLVERGVMPTCRAGFRTVLTASIAQTSLPCLEALKARFGGTIRTIKHKTGTRWAVAHMWRVQNLAARAFLVAVQPYTLVKRTQVDLALHYPLLDDQGRKYGNPGRPIPEHVIQERIRVLSGLRDIRASMKCEALPKRGLV